MSTMQGRTEPWTLANVRVPGVHRNSQVLLPKERIPQGTGCHKKGPVVTGCSVIDGSVSYRWLFSTEKGSHSCMDLGVHWELSRTLRMFGVFKTQ